MSCKCGSKMRHFWSHVECISLSCGLIKTDSGNDWGNAKNKWFKSINDAMAVKEGRCEVEGVEYIIPP